MQYPATREFQVSRATHRYGLVAIPKLLAKEVETELLSPGYQQNSSENAAMSDIPGTNTHPYKTEVVFTPLSNRERTG
jgi:hypothetical protein